MTKYRDFETDQYRLRFIKEGEGWICRLDPHVMEMIETSVTNRKAEPVAWIIDEKMTDCDDNFIWNTGDFPDWQVKDWIPLYTHPVKELTDEEIAEVYTEMPILPVSNGEVRMVFEFAKAILRKAQEK